MTAGMQLDGWLASCSAALSAAGIESPRREARLLARLVLGEAVSIAGGVVEPEALGRLEAVAARRIAREPLSRIRGAREFWGREFKLSAETLDPRPATETIVEVALGRIAARGLDKEPIRILDSGTGTGAILVTLLAELPEATGVGTDISEGAIATASKNAARHGIGRRARFIVSDWLARVTGTYHTIVSNPPYIRRSEIAGLEPEVARFDPLPSLDGGEDGLCAYRSILGSIANHLEPGGQLILEVGAGQARDVAGIIGANGLAADDRSIAVYMDLAGHERVVACAAHGALRDEITVGISGAAR